MEEKAENLPAVSQQPVTPAALIDHAGNVAHAVRQIVLATAQQIGARKYVRVEGWQAIAIAHQCVAGARDVESVPGGVRAVGEIRRLDTGQVIAVAEGFVGDDESTWAKRPLFARRAMAQTRAISRACRSAFAHVVVMLNAGLETTPAEEMDAMPSSAVNQSSPELRPAAPLPSSTAPIQATPPIQPPAAPPGTPERQPPLCPEHGEMQWRSGTSKKTGAAYAFWGCVERTCRHTANPIHSRQQKALFAAMDQHGRDPAELTSFLAQFGILYSAEITDLEYDEILNAINQGTLA